MLPMPSICAQTRESSLYQIRAQLSLCREFSVYKVHAYHDSDVRCQCLGVHDEKDDLNEAQGGFDYLPGPGRQQQADVV